MIDIAVKFTNLAGFFFQNTISSPNDNHLEVTYGETFVDTQILVSFYV